MYQIKPVYCRIEIFRKMSVTPFVQRHVIKFSEPKEWFNVTPVKKMWKLMTFIRKDESGFELVVKVNTFLVVLQCFIFRNKKNTYIDSKILCAFVCIKKRNKN